MSPVRSGVGGKRDRRPPSLARPAGESARTKYGKPATINRCRATARATREVSIVIHRRPQCSAAYAVVPAPQVGSSTRSPGSVVISRQRSMILVSVWTTYILSEMFPAVSSHQLESSTIGKSLLKNLYPSPTRVFITRSASCRRAISARLVRQECVAFGSTATPSRQRDRKPSIVGDTCVGQVLDSKHVCSCRKGHGLALLVRCECSLGSIGKSAPECQLLRVLSRSVG